MHAKNRVRPRSGVRASRSSGADGAVFTARRAPRPRETTGLRVVFNCLFFDYHDPDGLEGFSIDCLYCTMSQTLF